MTVIDITSTKDDTMTQLWPSNIPTDFAIAEQDPKLIIKQAIKTAASRYIGIEIIDKATYNKIAEGISVFRKARTSIEKRRKELGADHRAYIKCVNDTAKKITALIEPVEADLKAKKKVEDDKAEAIRKEVERKEAERIAGIQAKIDEIKAKVPTVPTSSDDLTEIIFDLEDKKITEADFQELVGMAEQIKADILTELNRLLSDRLKWEEEKKKRKAELVRIEVLRAENDRVEAERKKKAEAEEAARKAEQEKIEAERRAIEEEKLRLEEEKIDGRLLYTKGLVWNREFLFDPDDSKTPVITRAELLSMDGEEFKLALDNFRKKKQEQLELERKAKAEEKKNIEVCCAGQELLGQDIKGDKEKLIALADFFGNNIIDIPNVTTVKAKKIVDHVQVMINDISNFIQNEIKEWT